MSDIFRLQLYEELTISITKLFFLINMREDIRKPVRPAPMHANVDRGLRRIQKWDIVAGIPSLKGKVAIVTGAK
jgi:hypothetical protein